jgi:hypothetical protein
MHLRYHLLVKVAMSKSFLYFSSAVRDVELILMANTLCTWRLEKVITKSAGFSFIPKDGISPISITNGRQCFTLHGMGTQIVFEFSFKQEVNPMPKMNLVISRSITLLGTVTMIV